MMSIRSSIPAVVLAATCPIVCFMSKSPCVAAIAGDNASSSAYANGWQAGDNGGAGFGPWTLSFSGSSALLYPPQFIDNGPLAGDSLGKPTFALTTGDRNNDYETSEVRRTFLVPLAVGQTFSADVDGSALANAPSYTTGNTFDLLGTDGSERFSLFTSKDYFSDRWTATGDANTGIAAGSAFHISFKLVSINSYNLTLSPVGGGAPLFVQTGAPLAGTPGVDIDRIRISDYGTGSSSNGSKEMFFDNLLVIGLPGDYNNNNVPDAADYPLWRKTQGATGSYLAADGNNDNSVNSSDYTVWSSNFDHAAAGVGSAAVAVVPEPGAWIMLISGMIVMWLLMRWRARTLYLYRLGSYRVLPAPHPMSAVQ
jgi:hypothetical protein